MSFFEFRLDPDVVNDAARLVFGNDPNISSAIPSTK
jgi:hypothetical protein